MMGDIAVIVFKDDHAHATDIHGIFMVFEFLKHSWNPFTQEATEGLRLQRIFHDRILENKNRKNMAGQNLCKIRAGQSALVKNKSDQNCSYMIDLRSRVI
jgi:hypothetical protein